MERVRFWSHPFLEPSKAAAGKPSACVDTKNRNYISRRINNILLHLTPIISNQQYRVTREGWRSHRLPVPPGGAY
jgi:hypothetical protein